jgi:hypothetical protein
VREKKDNDEGGISFAASFNQAAAMAMNVARFSGSEDDFTRSRHSAAWRSNCSRLLSGSVVIQKSVRPVWSHSNCKSGHYEIKIEPQWVKPGQYP